MGAALAASAFWGCGAGDSSAEDREDRRELDPIYESRTGKDDRLEEDSGDTRVEYYNPNTGTRSEYELDVDFDGDKVERINFDNGGWIDDSHIDNQVDNDDGTVTVTTDKGYEYTVDKPDE